MHDPSNKGGIIQEEEKVLNGILCILALAREQRAKSSCLHRKIFVKIKGSLLGRAASDWRIIPHKCIVKGDAKYASIAAASVLAKTYRDEFMIEAAKQYPQYGWEKNFGYPTKQHREAIIRYGETPLHRKSFHCHNSDLSLELEF